MAEDEFESEKLKSAIVRAAQQLGYGNVKELQFEVIQKVMTGHNVFAVLPTGFGKSLECVCILHHSFLCSQCLSFFLSLIVLLNLVHNQHKQQNSPKSVLPFLVCLRMCQIFN